MQRLPAGRFREVLIESLPTFAPFRLRSTGARGLVLAWHRSRIGQRRECSVLLLHARGDDSPAIRRTIRAGITVLVDRADEVLLSTRDRTAADPFAHQLHVRNGVAFPDRRVLAHEDDAPELPAVAAPLQLAAPTAESEALPVAA